MCMSWPPCSPCLSPNLVQAQSKTVEHLRLEVDSRRRTVADLAAEVDDLRGRGGGGGDKARSALEVAVAKLENKKEKLAGGWRSG